MKVVVALGGNAIAAPGGRLDATAQRKGVQRAARAVVEIAAHHDVVVTHGNGPQVGLLAQQAEAVGGPGTPLDMIGAESEGLLGYLIEQELGNLMPGRDVAVLLTQVEVDSDDPAFKTPSKPIGPLLEEVEAQRLANERGWIVGPDRGGLRRLVPSPQPRRILEIRTIGLLMRLGVVVVCGGGGGIPVVATADGTHHGVEAVIDKDRSAVLLGTEVGAEHLLLLTDVPAVYADWPGRERPIASASPRALAELDLEAGTMGPKVEAACRFVKQTQGVATIGAIEDAARMVRGEAGTAILPGNDPIRFRS